ncbi:ABC transporter substrate-binding protein [Aneurinibacillus sp. Ricciae_BoGa-3]|uniref:ABC transporter substrate-binding protein n=1 Tax=Aneurinibacillus sp. Ricciae_BoGa-3 TaxID=3022697 RepID=UPI0023420558|nr:ABC transporter substrate-binding protein [Aneurinibacillus sp. Ricciae_BoGa-3]WCK55838.1 ABC transporter substrate-binding protein [Aneurinibacillus sp. Ricciae_BoGa-3]
MKNKWLGIFVAMLMLVLSACSAGTQNTAKPADASAGSSASTSGKIYNIGISQIVEHPALDAARKGFIDALKENGLEDGKNLKIDYKNAQNDQSTNNTIAQGFVADKKDLILGISTPSAQAALQNTKDIPVLFTAVSDPVGAKLVKDLKAPGNNVTGTSDTPPEAIANVVQSMHDLFPQAKKVGIIYNSGEANSVANVKRADDEMKKVNLTPVEQTVTNTSEVKQAAESLVGKVDLLYIPQDNTAVSAIKSIVGVAQANKIPLFVGEKESVKSGGFAGIGFEYYDLGHAAGLMAVKILKDGAKPGDMPVEYPKQLRLTINKQAAKAMGIDMAKLPKAAMDKWKPEILDGK